MLSSDWLIGSPLAIISVVAVINTLMTVVNAGNCRVIVAQYFIIIHHTAVVTKYFMIIITIIIKEHKILSWS